MPDYFNRGLIVDDAGTILGTATNPLPVKIKDALGNDVDFPGLEGVYNSYFLGTPPAGAADGAMVALKTDAWGALRISLSANGRQSKAHRFDVPHSPTYTDFNDAVPVLAGVEMRYDTRNSKLRRTDVIGANTRILAAAASTNATSVATTSATLGRVTASNERIGSPWYLKLYDKASAAVPASDVPFMVLKVKPGIDLDYDFGGYVVMNGLQIRACTGVADTDNTALATNDFTCFNLTHS